MKNIKMCDDEIINYFNEEGKLKIKSKWEKENKTFVTILGIIFIILFWFIPLFGWLFEKISKVFTFIDSKLVSITDLIKRIYFKKKYLKDYIIPSKNEIKECYKKNFDEK